MKLNSLSPNEGAKHNSKRVGRGEGSGKGKTCGKGQKGQKARSGVAIKGFEGGQMPLYQRLPKRGFNNIFAKRYATVSLARLQQALDEKQLDGKGTIDEKSLAAAKIIKPKKDGVKILGNDGLKSKITVSVAKATKGAVEAIEKAGGTVEIIAPASEEKTEKKSAKAE